MIGELIILVVIVTAAVPGLLLAAVCHWLLVDRVPDTFRRVLCAAAAMLPASLPGLGKVLGAYSGTRPVLVSLLLWVPLAVALERRRSQRTVSVAGPSPAAAAPGAAVPADAATAGQAPVAALPAADVAAANAPHVRVADAAPEARRSSRTRKIVVRLMVMPWLVPVALVGAIFWGLIGPFYESNGGVLLIALGVLLALLLTAIGGVVLLIRAARAAWTRRA